METKDLIEEWLRDYKAETRRQFQIRINHFLEWSKEDPKDLLKRDAKELVHMVVEFARDYQAKGVSNNSILAYAQALKSFLAYHGKAIKFKKSQLPQPQKAKGYHLFSNGDLGKMFEIANPLYKALLATHCSSGWSISDILTLEKERIEAHIERAKSENKQFIFLEDSRGKTNAEALLCLNPLAIEWLDKWIKQNEAKELFPITLGAVNLMYHKLAKRSNIKLTGKIRSHNIRKWTINSLIKAGFSTEEWKYIVGKAIGLSDSTYLNLKPIVMEKYVKVYEKYLSIRVSSKLITSKDEQIASLEEQIKTLRGLLIPILGGREKLERIVSKTMKPKPLAEDSMMPIQSMDSKMDDEELLRLYLQLLKKSGRA